MDQLGSDDRDPGYLVGRDPHQRRIRVCARGFFVVHSAYGKIGETSARGVEIISVDGARAGNRPIPLTSGIHLHWGEQRFLWCYAVLTCDYGRCRGNLGCTRWVRRVMRWPARVVRRARGESRLRGVCSEKPPVLGDYAVTTPM